MAAGALRSVESGSSARVLIPAAAMHPNLPVLGDDYGVSCGHNCQNSWAWALVTKAM